MIRAVSSMKEGRFSVLPTRSNAERVRTASSKSCGVAGTEYTELLINSPDRR